jgi:hypothetical protein
MTPAGRAFRSWLKTLDRRVSVGVHRAPWSSDRWTRVPPRGVGAFRPWPAVDVAEIENSFGEVCGLWARQTPSSSRFSGRSQESGNTVSIHDSQ